MQRSLNWLLFGYLILVYIYISHERPSNYPIILQNSYHFLHSCHVRFYEIEQNLKSRKHHRMNSPDTWVALSSCSSFQEPELVLFPRLLDISTRSTWAPSPITRLCWYSTALFFSRLTITSKNFVMLFLENVLLPAYDQYPCSLERLRNFMSSPVLNRIEWCIDRIPVVDPSSPSPTLSKCTSELQRQSLDRPQSRSQSHTLRLCGQAER